MYERKKNSRCKVPTSLKRLYRIFSLAFAKTVFALAFLFLGEVVVKGFLLFAKLVEINSQKGFEGSIKLFDLAVIAQCGSFLFADFKDFLGEIRETKKPKKQKMERKRKQKRNQS